MNELEQGQWCYNTITLSLKLLNLSHFSKRFHSSYFLGQNIRKYINLLIKPSLINFQSGNILGANKSENIKKIKKYHGKLCGQYQINF